MQSRVSNVTGYNREGRFSKSSWLPRRGSIGSQVVSTHVVKKLSGSWVNGEPTTVRVEVQSARLRVRVKFQSGRVLGSVLNFDRQGLRLKTELQLQP